MSWSATVVQIYSRVNLKKRKQVKFIKVKIQKSKVILPAALSPQSLPTVQRAAKKKNNMRQQSVSAYAQYISFNPRGRNPFQIMGVAV